MRPVLSSARRRLWRDGETLQLGRAPDRAVVLAGLDPADHAVLDLLDGTRDTQAVIVAAVAAGCRAQRAAELVDLLGTAGLLLDAGHRWPARFGITDRDRLAPDVASLALLHRSHGLPALLRRDEAAVTVLGAGRVGASVAGLLAAAGLGTVDVVDEGGAAPRDAAPGGLGLTDVGRRRGAAARDRLQTVSSTTRTGPVPHPDLVVLAPVAAVDESDVRALQRDGTPYLLAEVRDTVGVVGPLVVPGASACLRCLDLCRTDLDPGWPTVAAQLAAPAQDTPACDVVLAAAVAAQATLQVLAYLDDGEPASLSGSLELPLPDWRWHRRSWSRHPACSCRWQATG